MWRDLARIAIILALLTLVYITVEHCDFQGVTQQSIGGCNARKRTSHSLDLLVASNDDIRNARTGLEYRG